MMNLTSKTSKSFLLFKRALVLLCLALCSLIANAGGNLGGYYTVKVAPSQEPKASGAGKVYLSADWNMTANNSSKYSNTIEVSTELTATSDQMDLQNKAESKSTTGWNQDIYISCTNVKLRAESEPGSTFEGWKYGTTTTDRTQTTLSLSNKGAYQKNSTHNEVNNEFSPNTSIVYYPIFIAKTYYQKWPRIVIETIDKYGNTSTGGGSLSVSLGNANTGTQGGTTGTKNYTASATPTEYFTQTADDNGKIGQASYKWTITATVNSGYHIESLTYNGTSFSNGGAYTGTTTAMSDAASVQDVIKVRFKQDFTATYSGPKVAFGNNSADNGKITIGDRTTTKKTEPIDLSANGGSVTNTLNFQYTFTAENTDKATFVGWTLDPNANANSVFLSSDLSYTHTFTIDNIDNQYQTPTMYAIYESFYYRLPPLKFADGSYYGAIATSVDGTRPTAVEDWKTENIECGSEIIQIPTSGQAKATVTYHYHAMVLDDQTSIFTGFASDAAGENIVSTSLDYSNSVDINNKDANSATCPYDVYVVFKQNTHYYFKGAIAGFTENGEKGKITVTGYTLNSNDEKTQIYTGTTVDNTLDDSNKTYPTQLNIQKYAYKYVAEDTDSDEKDLTAFKGWSRSPRGGNIIDLNLTHEEVYTTYATTEDGATTTPALYAIFQSYWFKNPTASAVGAGKVAAGFEPDAPTNDNEWSSSILTTNELNQVAANDEKHTYSVWYHAQPNFGAYFAGWSNVADGSQLLTDDKQNPYKVDYNVTATDDTAPFVSPRLYAVFKSVIDVIQKDRMIYYVDENGHENINDANVIINFNQAPTLTATLKDNHDLFLLADKQNVEQGTSLTLDASSGIVHLVVSYIGDTPKDHIGKTATITLSSAYTDDEGNSGTAFIDVQITIEEMPYVSFLPTDGRGAYTIKHTDGRGIDFTMSETTTENISVSIAQENMATFELNLTKDTENDGLTFAGWQMIVDNVASYFSYDKKCTYAFKESAFVRPVFLADDRAVFTILNDPQNRKYYDLQLALNEAKAIYDADPNKQQQVVVFSNEDKIEGTLYQGNYTVPAGVMLLIPGVGPTPVKALSRDKKSMIDDPFLMTDEADKTDGKNNYVYRIKRPETISEGTTADVVLFTSDYTDVSEATNTSYSAPYATCYRKLIVEDNTSIKIENGGIIQLYAVISRSGQTYEASPYRYGQIEFGENCRIDVQNGASLQTFGYITGAHSSNVIVQSGGDVHEVFQYSDPRGGTGVAHLFLARSYYQVFPFSQYYIQNVEIPMEIKAGAVEYIALAADVMKPFVLMSSFVIPDTEATDQPGLFRLGNNTSLIKSYDPLTDRQKYTFKGNGIGSQIKFGFVKVDMGDLSSTVGDMIGSDLIGGVAGIILKDLRTTNLNSQEYVLPLNHNMDVSIESVELTIAGKFAFLAGSTMSVDEYSKVNITGSNTTVYLYDAVENLLPANMLTGSNYGTNTGYFSASNYPLRPITATPNNSHYLADGKTSKRLAKDVKDAKWIVNGTVEVASGAGLYTTDGGAQIVSTKSGKVIFNAAISNATTYQAKYIGGGASNLIDASNIFNIKVKNEGVHKRVPYAVTSAKLQNANNEYVSTNKNTFTYDPAIGKWVTGNDVETLQGAEIHVTLPDYDVATPDVVDPLIAPVNSSIDAVSEATIAWNSGTPSAITGITANAAGTSIPVTYVPTNKAGEYEGLINVNNGVYYQRVIVIEDYTPRFSVIEEWNTSSYMGYSSEVAANIVPEANNVAGILTGKYASTWTAKFTGEHADEFSLVWGEGENKLSDAKIVFKPKTSGNKTAVLSLTCAYTDAAKIKHTTCVQVPLTAQVADLASNTLAFADGVESIFISSVAQPLFKNINSSAAITISPETNDIVTITAEEIDGQVIHKIAPKALGSVTITATQEADLANGIAAATISKTITVTDDIVWNWDNLYLGSTNTNPITTKYQDWSLDLTEDSYNVILNPTLVEDGIDGWVAKVAPWEEGETTVKFTMTYWDGEQEKTKEFTSEVYRDPRHLSISVNDERIYDAITIATSATVEYAMGYVGLISEEKQPAQWTFNFLGIPDELSFTATGLNNWQIEESHNGTNWTIAYTWAKIAAGAPFELSLQPSTRYVRISYGTEHAENVGGQLLRAGTLSNITVTELKTVKADVNKLYMPKVGEGEQTSKNVVFTYVSEAGFDLTTTNNAFTTTPAKLPGLATDPFYTIQRVAVNSTATSELLGALNVKGTETQIPIQTFNAPQAIPIQLASDHTERYYYVAEQSYQTTWDETERTVVMHNAVADAAPYVVFHFADAPTPGIMSFNYSELSAGATWVVEESSDATNWTALTINGAEETGDHLVMREFKYPDNSRYLKITLVSDYAEVVSLSNVAILPTANVVVNPASLTVFDNNNEKIAITANNLQDVTFAISDGFQLVDDKGAALTPENLTTLFVGQGTKPGDIYVKFLGTKNEQPLTVSEGKLTITTTKDAQGNVQADPVVLATVELLGVKRTLAAGKTGIYTGVKTTAEEGEIAYKINGFTEADGANYREVDVTHAFAGTIPLFDYVIIYGATTTDDESTTITTPTSTSGSNAKTPCYIYKNIEGAYKLEDLTYVVDNANSATKSWQGAISISDTEVGEVDTDPEHLQVYITGFAPYASTGYSKADDGVWHFQGDAGDKIDIYLEDCYIYSRYKTKRGNSFSRNNGETFSDKVARGSGAVLLFENNTQIDGVNTTMDVTIHTSGTNLLKSHYGCLFESIVGRAFQVSAPVQIYMQSESHVRNSYTVLNFTDEWPTAADGSTTERTNGFVSLRKQVNNAPSIDMGNTNTVVNFRGGQVELQNACNSSDNYESTLAISARSGIMGPAKFRFRLAYGIGTDEVGGRVNFYDGTTTVLTMTVPERYRQYYLMDGENEELSTTSCLRTPKKTFIYGGSHCMMRACTEPTSKGGAPTDGDYYLEVVVVDGSNVSKEIITGNPLGLYQYTEDGWVEKVGQLVTPTNFPGTLQKEDGTTLASVHATYPGSKYAVASVTPNSDGKLNLWIPGGYGVGKQPEVEQMISYWKACMTKIEAKYGVYEGSVGGPTAIQMDAAGNQIEQVQNLLYCEIDQNIYNVISSSDYAAPVLNPAPVENAAEKYMSIAPTKIGSSDDPYAAPELKNNIENTDNYVVQNKVYYIVPAQADIWMAFTAPFDVKRIWIMETRAEDDLVIDATAIQNDYNQNPEKYPEYTLEKPFTWREAMLKAQARHNADFASFFGVAMALESKKPFDDIYADYIGWARLQDGGTTSRGKQQLVQFDGTNWSTADYYLYENGGVSTYDETKLEVKWQVVPADRNVLMTKGTTYSLFFPYCMGCWDENNSRDFWDYWTGKFLIFESTAGDVEGHTIDGTQSQAWENIEGGSEMYMYGNTSLSDILISKDVNKFPYNNEIVNFEAFVAMEDDVMLKPTQAFLYANITAPAGQKIAGIRRTGEIIYSEDNNGNQNGTSGHIPTVGGGNDLFITSIEGGINVAVAAPQYVRVLSSTGSVIYSGMIQTALDIPLPSVGVYVVSGENEVQKVLY